MEDLSTTEIIIAVLIHVVVPLLGIVFYFILLNKMKRDQIENPPNVALFLTFFIYGGLLLIILTSLFWYWSAMASLGFIFVLFVAPFIMLGLAIFYLWKRNASKYHKLTFYLASLYVPIIAVFYILIQITN
jgi:drug/metabolite transporter (DMT)-like permease